jgi:mannose-6-phosphate isomerase-like protein (cupin superfamily)
MSEEARIIETESLRPEGGGAPIFEGADHGGVRLTFFVVDAAPGQGPGLHTHLYNEVFLIQEGTARFWIGGNQVDAHAGQIVVAPAGVPHKFVNSGDGRLRSINMHPSDRSVQTWEEEEDA